MLMRDYILLRLWLAQKSSWLRGKVDQIICGLPPKLRPWGGSVVELAKRAFANKVFFVIASIDTIAAFAQTASTSFALSLSSWIIVILASIIICIFVSFHKDRMKDEKIESKRVLHDAIAEFYREGGLLLGEEAHHYYPNLTSFGAVEHATWGMDWTKRIDMWGESVKEYLRTNVSQGYAEEFWDTAHIANPNDYLTWNDENKTRHLLQHRLANLQTILHSQRWPIFL